MQRVSLFVKKWGGSKQKLRKARTLKNARLIEQTSTNTVLYNRYNEVRVRE